MYTVFLTDFNDIENTRCKYYCEGLGIKEDNENKHFGSREQYDGRKNCMCTCT